MTSHINKRKKEELSSDEEEELSPNVEQLLKEFKVLFKKASKNEDDKYKFISVVTDHMGVTIEEPKVRMPFETKEDNIIATMVQDLKDKLPSITSESPNETICIPKNQSFEGYTKDNTLNVDGFLYSDEDVDELTEQGKLPSNYCLDCGSKNTKPINFISHSTTLEQLKFMYSDGVFGDLSGKVVLDIGSRLGSVLYCGYLYSKSKKLVGIEINEYFHKTQCEMIDKYKMKDRVDLVCGDIMKHPELIKSADVIYMNNVLEFFQENLEKHIEFWKFLKEHTASKKGLRILTIPAIEETLKNNKIPVKLKGWLKRLSTDIPVSPEDPLYNDYNELNLYTVI